MSLTPEASRPNASGEATETSKPVVVGHSPPLFAPWLGLFETVWVNQGAPQLLNEHLLNIHEGSEALGLPAPGEFALWAKELPKQSGRWRWIHDQQGSRHFLQPESPPMPSSFSLDVAPQRVGSQNWDARFKTLSYLTHWQARRSVASDEAVLANESGELASGSMSNIFWITQKRLFTPPLEVGCRNGAVRRWIVGRFPVETVRTDPTILHQADEVFLTNSVIGIRSVRRFQDRVFSEGPVTLNISAAYQAYLNTAQSSDS